MPLYLGFSIQDEQSVPVSSWHLIWSKFFIQTLKGSHRVRALLPLSGDRTHILNSARTVLPLQFSLLNCEYESPHIKLQSVKTSKNKPFAVHKIRTNTALKPSESLPQSSPKPKSKMRIRKWAKTITKTNAENAWINASISWWCT